MDLKSNKEMIFYYHGSDISIENPRCDIRGYAKDFGQGFYITSIKEQAEKWALRKGKGIGTVSKYKLSLSKELKILKFNEMTDEWLDLVIDCRLGKEHTYDIIEGPMADDTIYRTINDYIRGRIPRDVFWRLTAFRYPTHQICICTKKAISFLEFIESYEVLEE